DDQGLLLPPRLAPIQVVIVPIWRNADERSRVVEAAHREEGRLRDAGFDVTVDDRDQFKPGFKYNEWEQRGVPLRIEIGPRDLQEGNVVLARRDERRKISVPAEHLVAEVEGLLDEIQRNLLARARAFREEHTKTIDAYDDLIALLEGENAFVRLFWCGNPACEAKVKEDTKATLRCIPFERDETEGGSCIVCGASAQGRVLFARAY
ncbi:MAG: proline--tRNA ligase, partial [Deltaproteobacteria bacterium]